MGSIQLRSAPALSDVHHDYLFLVLFCRRYNLFFQFTLRLDRCCTPSTRASAAVTTHAIHHHIYAPTCCWTKPSQSCTERKLTPGPVIDKISEANGEDDGGYADSAAGLETDGSVEEKQHSRSQVPPITYPSICQRAHTFYYAAPTICKSQQRV